MRKLAIAMLLAVAFNSAAYAAAPVQADGGAVLAEGVAHVDSGVVPGATKCAVPGQITNSDGGIAYCEAKTRTWQLASVSGPGDADPRSPGYQIIVPPPPQFVPTKVWDDGKFTYIQLRAPYSGDLPVVFAESEPGQFELLNAKWDEKSARFVIPNLISHVVMRVGSKYVEIDRTTAAAAEQPVAIRDTRAGAGYFDGVPASGVLVTRIGGICDQSTYKRTAEKIPMPVVEHRSFPCDAGGSQIVLN